MKLNKIDLIAIPDRNSKDKICESVNGNVHVTVWLNLLGIESVVRQQLKMSLWHQFYKTE